MPGRPGAPPDPFESPTRSALPEDAAPAVAAPGLGLSPGQLFAGRFRIVAPLGRGGMGEVYRADDLKLGAPVALKLLPGRLAADPALLAQFHAEVRLARQVTHPNVCRVYDIGEHQGRHFLSMEYVDGEDLASLLRRIGRLSSEKAQDILGQACAGLAAAHARGVLHRDLKPSNLMLDGRGRVRIMDFGLAIPTEEAGRARAAGTPAYMAPEQFTGAALSARTDVYALGLIGYELFTGRRPVEANTLPEWRRLREEAEIPAPSNLVRDLDPAIERVILQCLERDPAGRPASAQALAGALPGGDPLAAALAAGETPSPELVAAAGSTRGLPPPVAAALATSLLLATAGVAWLSPRISLLRLVPLSRAPAVLDDRARELAASLGYPAAPLDTAGWFVVDLAARAELARRLQSGRPATAADGFRAPVRYVYRQSSEPMEARLFRQPDPDPMSWMTRSPGRVSADDPPLDEPGMVRLELTPDARLLAFRGVPPANAARPSAEWGALFAAAGLDPTRFHSIPPFRPPSAPAERWQAWQESEGGPVALRIEGGEVGGIPVAFEAVPSADHPTPRRALPRVGIEAAVAMAGVLAGLGVVLALGNLRRGRADRRGAVRLALLTSTAYAMQWALGASHVATLHEVELASQGLSRAAWFGLFVWVVYLALEPYVRRHFPGMLISWSRLLAGGMADARVGRDAAIGLVAGAGSALAVPLFALAGPHLGWAPWFRSFPTEMLLGPAAVMAAVMGQVAENLVTVLATAFLLALFRLTLRSTWPAALVTLAIVNTITLGNPPGFRAGIALYFTMSVLVLLRFGLLAGVATAMAFSLLDSGLSFLDSPPWATGAWLVPLLVLAVVAAWAFWTAGGGRVAPA